jgi:hypothetical protein
MSQSKLELPGKPKNLTDSSHTSRMNAHHASHPMMKNERRQTYWATIQAARRYTAPRIGRAVQRVANPVDGMKALRLRPR